LYITKQQKRAHDKMTVLSVHVLSYNPDYYPDVLFFKVGDIINEFKLEMNRIWN
jgi:hypothetical protein